MSKARGREVFPETMAPMSLGGSTEPTAATAQGPENGQDRAGRPYCGLHNCVMVAQGGEGGATYYRCKVPTCGERAKRLRGEVPREPLKCPQRNCGGVPALEVVVELSNFAQLVMRCPRCGFEVQVPRPGFSTAPSSAAVDEDFGRR